MKRIKFCKKDKLKGDFLFYLKRDFPKKYRIFLNLFDVEFNRKTQDIFIEGDNANFERKRMIKIVSFNRIISSERDFRWIES